MDFPSNTPQQQPSVEPFSGGTLFDPASGPVRPRVSKNQAQDTYHAAAAIPYKGEWDEDTQSYIIKDERFRGLTIQEVITLKHADNALTGDQKSIDSWQDRMIGKPKQSVESLNLGMTYTEMLDMLAHQNIDEAPSEVVDVEAVSDEQSAFQRLLEEC